MIADDHRPWSSSIKRFCHGDPKNERDQNARTRPISPSFQRDRIDEVRIRRHNLSVIFPLAPRFDARDRRGRSLVPSENEERANRREHR